MSINDATPRDWDTVRSKAKNLEEICDDFGSPEKKHGYYFFNNNGEETKYEAEYWGDSTSCNVDKPAHYNNGGIEAIEYIHQQLGEGFTAYCEGNVMKYLHRWKYKNGVEDLKKAQWYLNRMIEAEETLEELFGDDA